MFKLIWRAPGGITAVARIILELLLEEGILMFRIGFYWLRIRPSVGTTLMNFGVIKIGIFSNLAEGVRFLKERPVSLSEVREAETCVVREVCAEKLTLLLHVSLWIFRREFRKPNVILSYGIITNPALWDKLDGANIQFQTDELHLIDITEQSLKFNLMTEAE